MTALDYLDRIEQTLTIPAAEYVPAIGDVFLIIREARAALSRSPVVGAVGGEPTEEQKDAARYRWLADRFEAIPDDIEGDPWYVMPIISLRGKTIREAIDAAKGAAK